MKNKPYEQIVHCAFESSSLRIKPGQLENHRVEEIEDRH